MSKKSKNQIRDREKTTAEYYDLKTDAVNKLLNAKDAPKVSDKEIRKYTSKNKFHIPSWVKIVFIKFWFAGAMCYFFLWGLGMYLQNLDLMVVLACALGASMDLMVNHLLHYFEPTKGEYDKWMMVTVRKFWSLFINILYAGLLLICVMQAYELINMLVTGTTAENAESVPVGVEPLLFGILFMAFDMLFIGIKNLLIKIFRDAQKKVSEK